MAGFILEAAGTALEEVRSRRPLIHELTNVVTVNDCANITLAVGGRPAMTSSIREVAEMAAAADALVLNLGTLQEHTLEAMHVAAAAAARYGTPIVLDPVGAGGTAWRTGAAGGIIKNYPVAVIRGNASEIQALAAGGKSGVNPGVDSDDKEEADSAGIRHLSTTLGAVIAVTGAVDIVSDGKRTLYCKNGTPLLPYVTGTGCMTTALIGTYAAVTDPFTAALAGILSMGIAGERAVAGRPGTGPGTLHALLMDEIYTLNSETLVSSGKVVAEDE